MRRKQVHHDDPAIGELLPHAPGHLEAVPVRQTDVEEENVWPGPPNRRDLGESGGVDQLEPGILIQ